MQRFLREKLQVPCPVSTDHSDEEALTPARKKKTVDAG
jgi:hypothetical protein